MVSINKPNLSQMCTDPTYMYLYLYVFTILKILSTTNPIKIWFLNVWYLLWFLNNIFRVWIKFCLGWSQTHCELTVEHGITVFTWKCQKSKDTNYEHPIQEPKLQPWDCTQNKTGHPLLLIISRRLKQLVYRGHQSTMYIILKYIFCS